MIMANRSCKNSDMTMTSSIKTKVKSLKRKNANRKENQMFSFNGFCHVNITNANKKCGSQTIVCYQKSLNHQFFSIVFSNVDAFL